MAISMKNYFKIYCDSKKDDPEGNEAMEHFVIEISRLFDLKRLNLLFYTEAAFEKSHISFFQAILQNLLKLESIDLSLRTQWAYIHCVFDFESLYDTCLSSLKSLESISITCREILIPKTMNHYLDSYKRLTFSTDNTTIKPSGKTNFNAILNRSLNLEIFKSTITENLGRRELKARINHLKELYGLTELLMKLTVKKGDNPPVRLYSTSPIFFDRYE